MNPSNAAHRLVYSRQAPCPTIDTGSIFLLFAIEDHHAEVSEMGTGAAAGSMAANHGTVNRVRALWHMQA